MSTLQTSTVRLPAAAHPAESLLPILHGVTEATPRFDGADRQLAVNLGYGRPHSLLPYGSQSRYDRDRVERDVPSVELENEVLKATFLPDWGGRLWSLVHKPTKRELLHRNPILQPANLALRDAWVAGGVEWNLGTTGHWPLTCSPLHTAAVRRPDGTPVLRMYEFERMRGLIMQVDAWLPSDTDVLYVHVRLINPSDRAVPAYWWSNIAVPETEGTRVLVPATDAYHLDNTGCLTRIPYADGNTTPPENAAEFFFDIPEGRRPWIAALDADGRGLMHTSTGRLHGRKLFRWGEGPGGQTWQRWLSGPDARYLEIQAGLTTTQLEHVPIPAGAQWTWLEAYGLLDASQGINCPWPQACAETEGALQRLIPRHRLDADCQEARSWLDTEPEKVLHVGSGWGALEHHAGTLPDLPGLPFSNDTLTDQQQPWLSLVQTGRLPVSDPPAAAIAGPIWRHLLEAHEPDWHSLLHLGLARHAEGDTAGAAQAWSDSLDLALTPWALRHLGELARLNGDLSTAVGALTAAHRLAPDETDLTIETLRLLRDAGHPAEALEIIDTLPPDTRAIGRVQLIEAQTALATGDLDRCGLLLDAPLTIADLREGEDSLDDLWFTYQQARQGLSRCKAVLRHPLPTYYDFRPHP
ncbi:DUF5107 domain-containing protein [Nocardia sp. NPDC004722]